MNNFSEDYIEKEEQKEYYIEKILQRQKFGVTLSYLVKWEGYPEEEATWEPASNLVGAHELIEQFNKTRLYMKNKKKYLELPQGFQEKKPFERCTKNSLKTIISCVEDDYNINDDNLDDEDEYYSNDSEEVENPVSANSKTRSIHSNRNQNQETTSTYTNSNFNKKNSQSSNLNYNSDSKVNNNKYDVKDVISEPNNDIINSIVTVKLINNKICCKVAYKQRVDGSIPEDLFLETCKLPKQYHELLVDFYISKLKYV